MTETPETTEGQEFEQSEYSREIHQAIDKFLEEHQQDFDDGAINEFVDSFQEIDHSFNEPETWGDVMSGITKYISLSRQFDAKSKQLSEEVGVILEKIRTTASSENAVDVETKETLHDRLANDSTGVSFCKVAEDDLNYCEMSMSQATNEDELYATAMLALYHLQRTCEGIVNYISFYRQLSKTSLNWGTIVTSGKGQFAYGEDSFRHSRYKNAQDSLAEAISSRLRKESEWADKKIEEANIDTGAIEEMQRKTAGIIDDKEKFETFCRKTAYERTKGLQTDWEKRLAPIIEFTL